MNDIQLFRNDEFSVRSINENGTLWFVAKDIALALEYSYWQPNIVSHVPECWKGIKRINTPGGEQEMLCLTEQGVYFFLGRSDKPKALPYQMWIAGDVVPQIRRTGHYSIKGDLPPVPSGVMEGARMVFECAGISANQLALALDKVYRSYTGRSALGTAEVAIEAPVKQQLLTPSEIAKHLGFSKPKQGARIVNKLLADEGYQRKVAGIFWEPTDKGANFAVMLDTNKRHSDGTPIRSLKWNSGIISVVEALLA